MDGEPRSRTRRRKHVAVIMVVGAIVGNPLAVPSASAHCGQWHEDAARDTSEAFDISGVRLYRKTEPLRGVARVRTHEDIDLGHIPELTLYVDSYGDSRPDRAITAMFDGASFGLACLGVFNTRTERHVDDCRVRTEDRLWQITFRWGALGAERHVQWWVETSDGNNEPDADDRAPDEGRFEH